jgi:predicted AAA+ superfamily ATPase
MIERDLGPLLTHWARYYPVVTLTGPRQSGKTTLCRQVFPDKPYRSLEPLETRTYAREDPRGFMAEFPDGAVLDEVQRAPDLLGYLQDLVDQDPRPGRFILTGSQHFGLAEGISQSLAGRTAVLHLLPPSLGELHRFPDPPRNLFDTLFTGAYPRIHDQGIAPDRWLADYLATYVQRDVRMVLNVGDLDTFVGFLRLCAGSAGQELNLSRLSVDAGIAQPTARAWLSVLETSFILCRIPAWHTHLRKRVVKTPKVHFFDSGLLCHLLGIQTPDQIRSHPLRGAIFESWVASEVMKQRYHLGLQPSVFHFREVSGLEVDLLVQDGPEMILLEAKSGQTMDSSFLGNLKQLVEHLRETQPAGHWNPVLVYGGGQAQTRQGARVLPWSSIEELRPAKAAKEIAAPDSSG